MLCVKKKTRELIFGEFFKKILCHEVK